jgi:hypothetical protein
MNQKTAQNLPVMLHKIYRELHNFGFQRESFVHKNYRLIRLEVFLIYYYLLLNEDAIKIASHRKKILKAKKTPPFLLIRRGEMNMPCKNRSFAPGGKTVFWGGAL